MSNNLVRGRFAPSPSGRMHLGNVFSCLIAWLSARSQGGEIMLRIEDLDPDRCKPEYIKQLKEDLLWLGLSWDGEPVYQSRRSSLYQQAFDHLSAQGLTYPCFCSRAELHAASAPHASDGQTLYSGRCRRLSPLQQAECARKRAPAYRLSVPDKTLSFQDRHYGLASENLAHDCGDFIIRRSDGVFAYQLAVVVDDALMGITEVVRGRDLLSSTPRQLYLYSLLGYPSPSFSHLPLLLAPDGRRLSKREKDLDLGALRSRFPSPEPILGRLAFLCGLLEKEEPISAQELLPLFSWEKLTRSDITIECPIERSLFYDV